MLATEYPDLRIEIVNMGIGGDTSRDVHQRWHTVTELKPNWVSLMIGVNDVWRQFDRPDVPESAVSLSAYRALIEELVASTVTAVKGFLLIAPFFLEADSGDPMREMVDRYRQAMATVAEEYGLPYYDTQRLFDRWLREVPASALSADRVHPTLMGHYILAKEFVETITAAGWL
jgi:lysophospholipase L1-like esterase